MTPTEVHANLTKALELATRTADLLRWIPGADAHLLRAMTLRNELALTLAAADAPEERPCDACGGSGVLLERDELCEVCGTWQEVS